MWLLDPLSREKGPRRKDYNLLRLQSRVWAALGNSMSFSAETLGESHAASNIILLSFAFMMLVLVSLYTATTCE